MKVHDFLVTTLDLSKPVKVIVDMKKYVEDIIEYFSVSLINYKSKTPAGYWLFETIKIAQN